MTLGHKQYNVWFLYLLRMRSRYIAIVHVKFVKVTIECLRSQSKPRKMKREPTIAIQWKRIRQLTSDSQSLPKFDAILFQERSETFMKKTVANLVSIFNMNCTEFASVLYRTFSKVMRSHSNDDERFSKSL